MIAKKLKQAILFSLFIYLPYASMAWGMLGHRIVGEIADSYLTPKARLAIQQILGNESMAMASNWADFIKSEPSYSYISSWHYINFKDGLSEKEMQTYLVADTATDAYTKINFLVSELKNKKLEKEKKLMYLRLLIHLVGDIHQPMHVSREEDQGGNKIYITWFGQKSNLHSLWDSNLIEDQKLSYTEYVKAINHTTLTERSEMQKQPISHWMFSSYQIAQQLYSEIKQPDQKLSYRYIYDHIQIANDQLVKGGVHLAGLLNQLFG
jgi:hypothetical protein